MSIREKPELGFVLTLNGIGPRYLMMVVLVASGTTSFSHFMVNAIWGRPKAHGSLISFNLGSGIHAVLESRHLKGW